MRGEKLVNEPDAPRSSLFWDRGQSTDEGAIYFFLEKIEGKRCTFLSTSGLSVVIATQFRHERKLGMGS